MKIKIQKMITELKKVDSKFSLNKQCLEITGVCSESAYRWERKEAPAVVELLYYNSKEFNHGILEMAKHSDAFPVLKMLSYYHEKTGKPVEDIILKD